MLISAGDPCGPEPTTRYLERSHKMWVASATAFRCHYRHSHSHSHRPALDALSHSTLTAVAADGSLVMQSVFSCQGFHISCLWSTARTALAETPVWTGPVSMVRNRPSGRPSWETASSMAGRHEIRGDMAISSACVSAVVSCECRSWDIVSMGCVVRLE